MQNNDNEHSKKLTSPNLSTSRPQRKLLGPFLHSRWIGSPVRPLYLKAGPETTEPLKNVCSEHSESCWGRLRCLCVKSVSKRCKLERRPSKCCLTHAGWCCKPTLLWVSVTVRAADRRRTLQRNRQTTRDAGVHRRLVAQFIHESDEWKKRSCVTERRGWRGRSPAVREMDEETQTGFTASCKSRRYVAI